MIINKIPSTKNQNSNKFQYQASSIQTALPSPQYILPSLPDGFFLEFVKPGADHGGDV
jgi:hypothetical protein